MTFTTLTFLLFLPLVFLLYWGVAKRRVQNAVLLIGSYFFYGWWDYRLCALILASSLVDYVVGLGLQRHTDPRRRKWLLGVSLASNLGLLGFFKYFNFFADNFVAMANAIGWRVEPVTLHILLPVGISFYTFQTLSYTIDIYRGRIEASDQLLDYLAFVSFFPQLVAGPIERAASLLPQFLESRSFDYEQARDGAVRVLWGFFKKMVIADNIGILVNQGYANPSAYSGPELMFITSLFIWQIYCDFSAYSDIAIGTARMFGFNLMTNFAYPMFAQTISEHWRRWHISLTTWFRDYVFIPLGGSKVPPARRAVNIFLTFVISGFWHGASWTYVIWGGLHGCLLIPSALGKGPIGLRLTDTVGGESLIPSVGVLARIIRTFLINITFSIFFRATDMTQVVDMYRRMFTGLFDLQGYLKLFGDLFALYGKAFCLLWFLILVEWVQRRHDHPLVFPKFPRPVRWVIYTAFFWATIYWGAEQSGEFIYFQF